MDQVRDDVRAALRKLRQRPGFTLTAILTLALGLGATLAIFGLVQAVLLRSLPVERPGELYRLGETNHCCVNSGLQASYSLYSFRLFEHLREALVGEFTDLTAFPATVQTMPVRRGAEPARPLRAQFVTANYFQVLGVQPAAGRLLQPADDRPDAEPVVVLSHQAWMTWFGGDPAIAGAELVVNGRPVTVAGVAARRFFGDAIRPNPPGLWIPMGQEPALRGRASLVDQPAQDWLYAIGRLQPGVTPEQAGARATVALQQWLEAQPFVPASARAEIPRQHIVVTPAGGGVPLMRALYGRALTALLVLSGLVLLIAAANLANLLLARADRGEAAIRAALGASPARLLRQSCAEGLLLALAGSAVAVWFASVGARALVTLAFPPALFDHVPVDTAPSATLWLAAIALAVVTGALFSAGPAWAMARTPALEALAGAGRSGAFRAFVPRRSLVVAQVALSCVLLSSAGLLARSLGRLEAQALGFQPEGRIVVHIDPPAWAGERDRLARLYEELREAIGRAPGVHGVSYALYSPMEGNNWSSGIGIAGRVADPASPDVASWNRVGPRYFETTGTRLLRGRLLTEAEILGGARAVVVNDAFRRRFFESADPVGQRVGLGPPAHAGDFEIAGVVEDVHYTEPRQPVRPMIFLPAFATIEYEDQAWMNIQGRSLLLRTLLLHASVDAGALEPAIRRAVATVHPDLAVVRVMALGEQAAASFRIERLLAHLTSLYALIALGLAAIGLYGVTAFTVSQRTREIGVHVALGADRARVVRAVVAGPLRQTIAGLAIGVPLAAGAGGALAAQLFGVGSRDPVAFGGAIAVLLAAAAAAAAGPALRAASIDPARALRGE